VTQDLCDVCAVSFDDVCAAVNTLARGDVRIVNLHPMVLADIWADIARVGEALGRSDVARRVLGELDARIHAIAARAAQAKTRPSVLSIEWIAPVMIGGMWMPELMSLAGGTALVTKPGEHAPTLSLAQLEALDPDVVLVKPCGFPLARTLEELPVLRESLPWASWRAVREGRVYVADGNAYFNRSGPRIVESLEILAACVHPELFQDFGDKHSGSFVRLADQ
jgi:iron complex transport system substrate-binding protein